MVSTGIFAAPTYNVGSYASYPPGVVPDVVPKLMVNLSKDHQLWEEAYSDFDDVNGNGIIDVTYNNTIEYDGYFDPDLCYDYNNGTRLFVPAGISLDYRCTNQFSGNFMNWASMTKLDMLRKVFFGGMRSTDTATTTILERAQIPNDGHAFVKFYTPTDPDPNIHPPINRLVPWSTSGGTAVSSISICNVTVPTPGANSFLAGNTNPPVMRFAFAPQYDINKDGIDETAVDFRLWDTNERFQCMWRNEIPGMPNNNGLTPDVMPRMGHTFEENFMPGAGGEYLNLFPNTAFETPEWQNHGLPAGATSQTQVDHVVRVQACSLSTTGCKTYPNGGLKPIGLLQTYGEFEDVHFGLLTGSYINNIQGGVLRKPVGDISAEINIDTDGTFVSGVNGFIDTLNRLALQGYHYGNYNAASFTGGGGTYLLPLPDGADCPFNMANLTNGRCPSWGNPIGEMYVEALRYFAGAGVQSARYFSPASPDTSLQSDLPREASWNDPLNERNYCAPLNVLTVNANVNTYDSSRSAGGPLDYVPFSGLPGSPNINTWTDSIGTLEGINGNDYLVGVSAGANNEICSPKTVNNLSRVEGICPKGPTLKGSFNVAGAARFGYLNDLRPDLPDTQNVRSFAINMEGGSPIIEIPKPSGDAVKFMPAMRNGAGGGTLMTFKILDQTYTGTDLTNATYFVSWEDSEQGGDYDMDMWGTLEIDVVGNNLEVISDVVSQGTPSQMTFGYVVANTNDDRYHALSGTSNVTDFSCTNCNQADGPASRNFNISGSSSTGTLEDPLYYAAKYAGFDDDNRDGVINDVSDWDNITNSDGSPGADGIPDAYFRTTNPKQFAVALNTTLQKIAKRGNYSTTDAPVASSSYRNVGITVKTAFDTRFRGDDGTVDWVGYMVGLFVDRFGYLREDLNGDKALGDYLSDPVIEFQFNDATGQTEYRRLASTQPGYFALDTTGPWLPFTDINAVWNAAEQLSTVPTGEAYRDYTSLSTTGRRIFTAMDTNNDGFVETAEALPLNAASITNTNFGFLGVADEATADNIAEYTRGVEISGLRERTVNVGGVSTKFALGDIAGSSPLVVGRPSEHYDVIYRDADYARFARRYGQRRHVAYVGANDGMLHAFNMGYFHEETLSYQTGNSSNAGVAHPLGGELWGYVPQASLPHLQWLADPGYRHTNFVDGKIKAFDAQIFSDGDAKPGGWGTVLTANMGLGGGKMTVDIEIGRASCRERVYAPV